MMNDRPKQAAHAEREEEEEPKEPGETELHWRDKPSDNTQHQADNSDPPAKQR
jgi:hypothetical protein